MLGKNNHYLRRLREGEKITHYTIKKLSVGVASVAVGSFIMLNSGQAYAAEPASVQPATAHTQAESSDGTGASQESSVSEQAAVLSASSEEASLVSAESSQSSETSTSSESANSNEANSSESSQSSADESKPEQKEDSKLEPSRQNDTRKTPGYAVKPVEKPASAAMPRPEEQGKPMTPGTGLRGKGTGAYETMKAPTGAGLVQVIDPQSLNDEEKRRIREAFIRLNPNFRLSERNIDFTDDGKIVITDSKKQHRYEAFLDEVVTRQQNPAATAKPTVNNTFGGYTTKAGLFSTDDKVTGTGIAGATIRVIHQDNSIQEVQVKPDGTWEVQLNKAMRPTQGVLATAPKMRFVQIMNNQESDAEIKEVELGEFRFVDNNLSTSTTPNASHLIAGQKVIEILAPLDAKVLSLETNVNEAGIKAGNASRSQLAIRWDDTQNKFVTYDLGTFVIGDTPLPSLIEDISVLPSDKLGYQIIRITVSDAETKGRKYKITPVGELIPEYRRVGSKQVPNNRDVPVLYSIRIVPKYHDSSATLEYYKDPNRAPQFSYADASNVAPSIEVAPSKATKEVAVGQSVSDADILSMVNVTDPEDDARQTVGTPVAAEIVSRTKDGQTYNSIDTSSEGEYTVTLRAKDSQGKLSANTVQVQVLVGLKREAAKQAVADAAQRKNTEIDNNVDLTTEERAVERQKVTDAQNSANTAIDQAKTSQALAAAQNNGTSTINALTQTPVAKPAARAAIETAANNKVQQINTDQYLTNEERTEQIAAVRQKETAAKQAVAAQTSTQDVTSTQNAQVQDIKDTLVIAVKKPAVEAAIREARRAKRQEIENSDLLAEEKSETLREWERKVNAAKEKVKEARSNQDVQNVIDNELRQIQEIPTQSPSRQAAANEIMDAYNARKQLISNESWLTTDEKDEKLRELEAAKNAALERVKQASEVYELNSAKVDGISTVNSVSIQGTKKPDAKNTVDAAREAMSTALNATSSDWTAEEKLGANDKLLRIAEATEARILAATSNDNLQQVVNEMLAEIEAVKPKAIVKPAARKDIEEALAERIKQIQAQGDLTVEEREQYLEQVKQAAQDAHQDILASYGEVEVEHAKETALAKINAPAVPVKRNTALAAVRQEAETKRQEIENNLDLTANERDVLLGQVDQVLAAAEQAINQGARNADVEDKQTEGTNNIRAIQVQASVRPQAIQAVNEQADAQRLAINQAQGLTENERQAALNQLDQALAKAISEIRAADDNDEVDTAKTKGIQAIQAVTAVAKIKNEAIQSVRQVADTKKDNIQQNPDLTAEERKTLTDAIEAEVQKAVGLINQANSNETVTAEKNLAEETIANLLVTPEVKPNAIKELQDQAAIKTREIQENKSLTDEERQKFTQDLQQALDNAKKQIQDAENNQAVSDAKTQGLGNIVAISPYGQVKADALAEIEAAREAKSREIQSKEGLTAEERQAAETRLATEVQTAKDSIGQAADNAGVGNAKSYGLTAIQAIKPEPLTKQAANEALDNAAQTKRQQITDNKNLTTQEKQAAIAEVDQALATAKGKVEQAAGRDDVAQAQAQGLNAIGDVTGQAVKKPQANADIEAAVAAKRQEIEGNKTLTNEERLTAYTQLEAKRQDALQAIADAASNEDVEQALNAHKPGIQNFTPTASVRQAALDAFDREAAVRSNTINNYSDFTDEEREDHKQRFEALRDQLRQMIQDAGTDREVEDARDNGISGIHGFSIVATKKSDAVKSLNEEAQTKRQQIQTAPNLTDEERVELNKKVDQVLADVVLNVHRQNTNDKVQTANETGVEKIRAIGTESKIKAAANQALGTAAENKRNEIRQNNLLTKEEKDKAIESVDQALTDALQNISQATTNQQVGALESQGLQSIQDVPQTPVSKPAALAEVRQAAANKTSTIQSNDNLTSDEKAEAIQKVNTELAKAEKDINEAADDLTVGVVKQGGITNIGNVQAIPSVKPAAIYELEEAASNRRREIQQTEGLTKEEREQALAQVENALQTARQAITQADSNAAVATQKTQGIQNIQAVTATPNAKPTAINEIEAAAETRRKEIQEIPGLTQDEINAAKERVNQAATLAKREVEAAADQNAVDQAKTNGLVAINAITQEAKARPDAIKEVVAAADRKKAELRDNQDLTIEERAQLIQDVDTAVDRAKDAINAAETNDKVAQEQTNGTQTIAAITANPVAKPAAKSAIQAAAQERREAIDRLEGLTSEEKNQAKLAVTAAEAEALEKLKQAQQKTDVDQVESDGIAAIKAVPAQAQDKPNALQEIQTAAEAKKRQIEESKAFTQEEKNEAIQKITQAVQDAQAKINQAEDRTGVANAKGDGLAAIEAIQAVAQTKPASLAAIAISEQAKKNEIENNNQLTREEKNEAISAVEAKARDARTAIENANTLQEVEEQERQGKFAIDSVPQVPTTKATAINEIETAAATKRQEIRDKEGLTEEERNQALAKVDSAVQDARNAINTADTKTLVDNAKENGLGAIRAIQATGTTKTEAKEAIERAAEAQRQAIQNRQDLTQDEKDAAKAQVTQAAASATKEVEDAADQNAVTQAKTNGTNTIAGISPAAKVRPDAIKAVEAAAEAKKREITDNQQLTSEEKAKAIQAVNDAVQNATAAINAAGTNAKVAEEQGNGTTAIAGINPSPVAKPAAIAAVEQAANVKKAAIRSNDALTSDEKAEAERKVNEELSKAQAAIRAAASDEDVTREQGNGTTAISGVAETPVARPTANQVVEAAAAAKRQEIKSNDKLTEEEQQAALAKVDEAERQAKEAIKQATSTSDVEAQGAAGKAAIEAIKAIEDQAQSTKDLAKAAITQAEQDKKRQIENNTQLTREEKNDAISAVEAKAEAARNAIDAAKKLADVQAQEAQGKADIAGVPETPAAKNAAKAAIQAAADLKKDEIRNNGNLTDEEKAEAIGKVDEAVTKANQAIDEATTNQAVTDKQTEGTQAIQAVPVTAVAKPAAIAAVQAAADAKKQHIQANGGLTEEERKTAIAEVESELAKAKQAIQDAAKQADVTGEQTKGIAAINNVAETPSTKTEAKEAIERAAEAQRQAIQNRQDLTQDEKDAAKAQVTQAAASATKEVEDAADQNAVTQAKTNGTNTIAGISPAAKVRPDAIKAVEAAAEAKKREITDNQQLTSEEKAKAIQAVNDAVQNATAAINAAGTNAKVAEEQGNGTTAIAGINPSPVAKPAAIAAVEQAANVKKAAIRSNAALTSDEKAEAERKVNEELAKAQQAINAAADDATVTTEKDKGVKAISDLSPTPVAKPTAQEAIQALADTKKGAIQADNRLTQEEKNTAINQIQAAADAAKQAIASANSDSDVANEKTAGEAAINAVAPTPTVKPTAKDQVQAAADAKKQLIQDRGDLTKEEKKAAKAAIDKAAQDAQAAIDAATTDGAVANEKANGLAAIEAVTPGSVAKTDAKQAINAAANLKKDAIQERTDLTQEEKEEAIKQVEEAAKEARNKVDTAATDAQVVSEKDAGLKAITDVTPNPIAKPTAKQAVQDLADLKKSTIEADKSLTREEKDAAIKQVEDAAKKAKEAIDAAPTNSQVATNRDQGKQAIADVTPVADAKPKAKEAVEQAANAKKAAIEADKNLTREEKDAAISAVDQAAQAAKTAIAEASDNSSVANEQGKGTSAIAGLTPVAETKPKAKEALEQAANAKKAAIEANNNLTREEKEAAKAKVDAAVAETKDAIDAATTNAEVAEASKAGADLIDALKPSADKKTAAKEAIDAAVKTKTDAIDARTDLTQEEKDAAKAKLADTANKAKAAIDAASTNSDVDAASQAASSAINGFNPTADAKTAAKAAIDQAVADKAKEIDARTDLTQEEKDAAKAKLADAANKAKAAIDAATTNAEVDAAVAAGTKSIADQSPSADAKTAAKAAIDQAVADKAKEIDARTDLTQEEKDAAKAKLADAAKQAKAAIDSATTNAEVDAAVAAGTKSIKDQSPSADAKNAAKAAIDQAVADKAKEIDARTDLTQEEKDAAKAKLADAANKAKAAIDAATTNAEVDAAVAAGTKSIKDQSPSADAKNAAKAAIDQAVADKAKEIDARTDLTQEEKDAAKAKLADAANKAKAAIDAATTNAEVDAAVAAGTKSIKDQSPSADAKNAAKAAIDQAVADKAKEIDARTDLTQEEKDAAKAKLADAANKAKAAIDAASTNAEVDAAVAAGIKSIADQSPSADAKTAAKAAIDQAVADKAKEIDARTDLTQEEKDAAKAKLADTANKAKAAIDAATTNADVAAVVKQAQASLKDFSPSSDSKSDSKLAIDQASQAKIDALKARKDLNDADKAKAIAQVQDLAQKAKDAIDQASSQDQVKAILDQALTDIAALNPAPSQVPCPDCQTQAPCPDCDAKKQGLLPATGETSNQTFFSAAALAVLAGLGLVAAGKRKDEEEQVS